MSIQRVLCVGEGEGAAVSVSKIAVVLFVCRGTNTDKRVGRENKYTPFLIELPESTKHGPKDKKLLSHLKGCRYPGVK